MASRSAWLVIGPPVAAGACAKAGVVNASRQANSAARFILAQLRKQLGCVSHDARQRARGRLTPASGRARRASEEASKRLCSLGCAAACPARFVVQTADS